MNATQLYSTLRRVSSWGTSEWTDVWHCALFVARPLPGTDLTSRLRLVVAMFRISFAVECPHTQREMLMVMEAFAKTKSSPQAVFVEAGCYKGGSTAKLSLMAKLLGRRLIVFDSFEGLPDNSEQHGNSIFGEPTTFVKGAYCGTMERVATNVRKYGHSESVEMVKGWFDDTMPSFKEKVAVAYVDVDLVSSTKTCLKFLYPLLVEGGTIFSQDAHLPLIIELLSDQNFWRDELGASAPAIPDLGKIKLVAITK